MSETVSEQALRLAEAVVFAAAEPVPLRVLATLLPEGAAVEDVVIALRARFAERGVELAEVAGGLSFRTAPDLAQQLKRVIPSPRRLPRAAMETLAIVAYHQPVTRAEIEEIRGVEVIAGVNLPMLVKLAKVRSNQPLADAVTCAEQAGRKYIAAASHVLHGCKINGTPCPELFPAAND